MVPNIYTRIFLGWCLIGFVIFTIVYNMASVAFSSVRYFKLVYKRLKTRAAIHHMTEQKVKVNSIQEFKSPEDIVEVCDNEK